MKLIYIYIYIYIYINSNIFTYAKQINDIITETKSKSNILTWIKKQKISFKTIKNKTNNFTLLTCFLSLNYTLKYLCIS